MVWDNPGDRQYEYGIEQGALYLRDGPAVAWPGLKSIDESHSAQTAKTYYLDGQPFLQDVTPGAFEGTIKAYTYPEVFNEVIGTINAPNSGFPGMRVSHQRPKTFDLAYKTLIGNDTDQNAGYKIHILYGLKAIPDDVTRTSLSLEVEPNEFSWPVKSVPQSYGTNVFASHVTFSSLTNTEYWMSVLEGFLYGTDETDPFMPNYAELIYNFFGHNTAGPPDFP